MNDLDHLNATLHKIADSNVGIRRKLVTLQRLLEAVKSKTGID